MFASLSLQNIRNLTALSLVFEPGLNLIFGENGAGKTSVLEAIYLLACGRSFRTRKIRELITHGQQNCTVFSRLNSDNVVGVHKTAAGVSQYKLNQVVQSSVADISQVLPLQLIHPHSFFLLEAGPQFRRKFLDWGVFHVEPSFLSVWREVKKLLKQRNALLRQKCQVRALKPWDEALSVSAEKLQRLRAGYFDCLAPMVQETLGELSDIPIQVSYDSGWPMLESYAQCLEKTRDRDLQMGFTRYGPHRADLKFKLGTHLAAQVLSRGQKKALIIACKLAQSRLLKKPTIYLIDDLTAELDRQMRNRVIEILLAMKSQVIITSVDADQLQLPAMPSDIRRFHVKP